LVSAISADAPEKHSLIELRSTLPARTSGWLRMAVYSVGTPLKNAGFTRLIVAKTSAMSRGFGTSDNGLGPTNAIGCTPTFA
jgi:hypothetical protein